jgi:hypothetical protein
MGLENACSPSVLSDKSKMSGDTIRSSIRAGQLRILHPSEPERELRILINRGANKISNGNEKANVHVNRDDGNGSEAQAADTPTAAATQTTAQHFAKSCQLLESFYQKQPAVQEFHKDMQPTKLKQMPALAAELGIERCYVKDESTRMGLKAFKGLGVGFAVDQKIERNGREKFFGEVRTNTSRESLVDTGSESDIICVCSRY